MANQKEIVLLPYPFSNLKENKIRPALIISNNKFNKKSEDCIMVPLTAVIKDEPYSILINQKDLFLGKLIRPSRIRVDKIFSVEKNLIKMKIGIINNKVLRDVKKEIGRMF
ncbi:type II toxin-antitoxin system PemK/MazF family toxin [Candidatus Pacearchaeota archaeon]|nr:type II toxin-antitoxin system PemK/MazF family toxin [Candidatus Pacearchaeota archaeon]